MTYFRLDFGDIARPVTDEVLFSATGHVLNQSDRSGGQGSIPDTVGRFRHLIYGTNIGAVRTPLISKRNPIDLPRGIAVVTQLDPDFSAICQMTSRGALCLATKILEEIYQPYWGMPLSGQECLARAVQAARDADYEARTARVELL